MAAYDEEAKYFDGGVRTAKRRELRARLITALRPAAAAHLGHCATKLMQRLKDAMAAAGVKVKLSNDTSFDFAAAANGALEARAHTRPLFRST